MIESKKVPLIQSQPLSEFGDFPEYDNNRPAGLETDGTYVPGFSEMRVARDVAVGQFLRGEINRSEVPTLPVNLRWARSQNKAGQADSTKPFKHSRRGYRYVTKENLNSDWLKELPGGTQWNAAGQLQNGDTVLMVADARDAARNESQRRRETEERTTGVTNSFTQKLAEEGIKQTRGTDPSVEKMAPGAKLFTKKDN